jgi:hypothetical protein
MFLIIDTASHKGISYKEADRFGCEVWIMDIVVSGVRFFMSWAWKLEETERL